MNHCRWGDRHPLFVRFYVPLVVTLTLLAQVWEMTR